MTGLGVFHYIDVMTAERSLRAVLALFVVIVLLAALPGCQHEPDAADSLSPCLQRARFGDPAASPYVLPYPVGMSYRVYQTYCGPQNHGRDNQLAYDFEMPLGSPVLAARAGTVVHVFDTHLDSDEYDSEFNCMFIRHDDGTAAFYAHLRQHSALVREGDAVQAGQHIADLGHLGNPVADLLHFGVYRAWPARDGDDLAVNFRNADGPLDPRGGLVQGMYYLALPY
jgi:murein DD-endopeptidase MepM/ murein hydrolase activator NlpD